MSNIPILVCQCGMRLKAAGATPGRVGRCPSCGDLLRVPPSLKPEPAAVPKGETNGSPPRPRKPRARESQTFQPVAGRSKPVGPPIWDGFLPVPTRPEGKLRQSLLYPLWGATGIALLVFAPPLLWFTSLPFLSFANAQIRDDRGRFVGLVSLLPAFMLFAPIACFILLFLGRVLVASALGESHHPRWPEWELEEMFRGLRRWFVALIVGGVIGGLPAVAYWIYCGDIDLMDASILIELAGLGVIYAQVALLASILHDDPLGANPVTVLRSIRRTGWANLRPASCTLAFGILMALLWKLVFVFQDPTLSAMAYWLFWVSGLYGMMVVLRVLGLFYHRHSRVLGWFRDRPTWGA